ncbi:MAG: GAF domain-containing protein [Anaerolineales bacterium]
MLNLFRKLLPEKITSERELHSTTQLLRTLVIVSLFTDLAALILVIIGGFGLQYILPISFLLISAIVSFIYLRRGNLLPAQIILPVTLYLVVTLIILPEPISNGYGLHDINLLAYSVVILLASLTLGQGGSFAFAFLIILSVFAIGIGEMRGVLVSATSSLTLPVSPFAISVVILAVTFIERALINRLNENVRSTRASEQVQIKVNAELRELQASLENRVSERTAELESANEINARRAKEFEALTLVAGAINSIRRMEELLPQVASVISERFGYYHVGIFLNDENSLTAILSASNSEGGKRMLERGHRLKVGEQGIVGTVASTGKIRIARNVGNDAAYFNNPDLPETLSEMALPLRSSNKVIGVLDVQSKQADAFSQDDVSILSLLADQVSLAIDNTRLFETTSKSLADAEALYRQYLRQAWNRLPREERLVGYHYTITGASPLESRIDLGEKAKSGNNKQKISDRLIVPIKLRGELIGNLVIQTPGNKEWSRDQLDLVQAVADRVALSAENARLFDETSRRAERERMVTDITAKIRSTNNPEEMIGIALNELRNALGATEVQLIPQAISVSTEEIAAKTSTDKKVGTAPNGHGAIK